ncbi:HD domain-containing protein [Pseudomonas borbori]
MTTNAMDTSWARCWRALGAEGDGTAVQQQLLAAYAQPQRHYHTLQHLEECLTLLAGNLGLAVAPGELEIALWFHDAVYQVRAHDNEQKSADWAATALTAAGVVQARVDNVVHLIMATCHAAPAQDADQQLLVDIDLAILGSPRARFLQYEAQIRAEYSWVPGFIFRRKRREVLGAFMARERIYQTPALYLQFEQQARLNLALALEG